ncbi:ABC transporter substrate-binding protein [Paracidovorax anthurii]|uniref:ABC-type branched-subunit amino acid transport system substrate-binding protein n=1 Tax=Paracidovorax anthurii TaxID=78229 RepID=A0A328Z1V4_9BURK|nr:ABC transporter substrate-binding protein [Paracidovorax anthurii]RAR79724.1 ABC-type branched-subunit amino acid transport system substrate-binding protein [Paracidovorax anthurii]
MPFSRRLLLQSAALTQLPLIGRAARAADTIRVGQTVALSGSFGEMGTMYTAGLKAAFAHHNQRMPQRKVELISLDDKLDGALATQNAKTLIEQENAVSIIGVTGTGVARAIMPYCEDKKIPLFALTGDDALRKVKQQYTFFSCASYGDEVKNMVRHGATIAHKSVFVVHTDVPAGSTWVESAKASAADNKLEFKGSIAAAPDGSNADAVAQAYLASKANFVVLVYAGAGVKILLEKLHQAHVYPGSIYLLSQGATPGLVETTRHDSSGLIVSQVVPNPFSAINPLLPEYEAALKAASAPKNYLTYQGFLLGQMFVDALSRIRGNATPAAITDALQDAPFAYKNYKLDYTGGKRLGTAFTDISMLSKDGRFIS